MQKLALTPTPNLKFALPQTQNPNASQWNIGCVGSQTQNVCVGNVHFIFFVCRFHLRLVANENPISSGIWVKMSLFTVFLASPCTQTCVPPAASGQSPPFRASCAADGRDAPGPAPARTPSCQSEVTRFTHWSLGAMNSLCRKCYI